MAALADFERSTTAKEITIGISSIASPSPHTKTVNHVCITCYIQTQAHRHYLSDYLMVYIIQLSTHVHSVLTHFTSIGIPDAPEFFGAVPNVTSIRLSWSPPSQYHGAITQYQVSHRCAAIADTTVTNDGKLTLTGLKPATTCLVRVRAYTAAGAGGYSGTITSTSSTLRESQLYSHKCRKGCGWGGYAKIHLTLHKCSIWKIDLTRIYFFKIINTRLVHF